MNERMKLAALLTIAGMSAKTFDGGEVSIHGIHFESIRIFKETLKQLDREWGEIEDLVKD